MGSPPYSTSTGSLFALLGLLELRPVRRESTDLDLDCDLDRDRESALASFLALCLSYSPVTAAPVTPAAAIGTPWRTRLGERFPLRFRDLLRWRSTRPATAALARPTEAARLFRCLGSMCLLVLRDLPRLVSSMTVTDLDLLLPCREPPRRRRDLLRCSSTTVVTGAFFSLFRFPTAYAARPTPARAASVPTSLTRDLLRWRLLLRCLLCLSRSEDRERERSRLL